MFLDRIKPMCCAYGGVADLQLVTERIGYCSLAINIPTSASASPLTSRETVKTR